MVDHLPVRDPHAMTPARTSLAVFTDPRSVAVVGASADRAKWGYWLARGALRGSARRRVHLVNLNRAVIDGVESVPSLRHLDQPAELVVLCTPAGAVPALVEEALELGARGLLVITAGVDAAHDEPGLEDRLAGRSRAAGARLIGPNCLGIYDAAHHLELAWGTFHPGTLAVVSQSGQLGLELSGLAAHTGLGISRFVSIGNQRDVTAVDVLEELVTHETTRAVVLYLEEFGNGRALLAALARLRGAGKPVVVLTVGSSEAGRLAARSHTGALTARTDVVAAAVRAAGAVLVNTPVQAVELAQLLLSAPLPRGRRVAVVSDSGGQGAIAADALTREGLHLPRLTDQTSRRLAAVLPPAAGVLNPVDLAGGGERDLFNYARVVETLLAGEEVDALVLSGYFGSYGLDTPDLLGRELEVVAALAEAARRHGRPVLVHSMSSDSEAVRSMRARGLPTLHTIDGVARSLGLAVELGAAPATGLTLTSAQEPAAGSSGRDGQALDYLAARDRLELVGIPYPAAEQVRSVGDVRGAAARLVPPYALKAGWLAHKTEAGGVATGLADSDAAVAAFTAMATRLGQGGYVLEEMDTARDVVELVIGARRDPGFGPLVVVGLGGVQAEVSRDVQVALAPVERSGADQMIAALRGYPLLLGWRGRPACDVAAAADAVVALSRLIAEAPDIVECEVNPLRVHPHGATAVDALVVAVPAADRQVAAAPPLLAAGGRP